MNEKRLREELRDQRVPGEDEATERSWEVVRAAMAERDEALVGGAAPLPGRRGPGRAGERRRGARDRPHPRRSRGARVDGGRRRPGRGERARPTGAA